MEAELRCGRSAPLKPRSLDYVKHRPVEAVEDVTKAFGYRSLLDMWPAHSRIAERTEAIPQLLGRLSSVFALRIRLEGRMPPVDTTVILFPKG